MSGEREGAEAPNVIQITPFMHVRDLAAALDFWCGLLGFSVRHREPGYAYVAREAEGGGWGQAAVRILEAKDAHLFPPDCGRYAYYLDVRDVDAIHAELEEKLAGLPPGDVHGPADKSYGQRELLIRAPDRQLVVFGQAIAKS